MKTYSKTNLELLSIYCYKYSTDFNLSLIKILTVRLLNKTNENCIVLISELLSGSRPGQKEPEPRNRTEITENRNRTNRTEGTVMKFGSGFLRTEINEIFSVLHSKEPKEPKEPKNLKVL